MKKYQIQDIFSAKFPNIIYNTRHEIMTNVIIPLRMHQYFCIGRCGKNVGYRFLYRDKNRKQWYSKQTIIHFGNETGLNRIGIYDPTPNNILLVASMLLIGIQAKHQIFKKSLDIPEEIDFSEVLKLANYIALNAKINIIEKNSKTKYRTLDNAIWRNFEQNTYFEIKDVAAEYLSDHLYSKEDGKFTYAPVASLHPASWYEKNKGQTKLKF